MQVRFDGHRYRDCKWCGGKGCIYCAGEADKAYKAEFPDGPVPLATFDLSKPEDVAAAKQSIGADAIRKAFGPGGGGIQEVVDNIAKARHSDQIVAKGNELG